VINLTCTITLTPQFGIDGALTGTAAGNTAAVALTWLLLRRRERRPWITAAFRPYATVGVLVAFTLIVQHSDRPDDWRTLVAAIIGFTVAAVSALVAVRAAPVRLERRRMKLKLLVDDQFRLR
jgi:O-antigen/teichoic acid export membrane protein